MTKPNLLREIEIADESERAFRTRGSVDRPIAAGWRAAEARLYPLIMVDAALYEAAVTLVGEAVDVLRERCQTVSDLVHVDPVVVLSGCSSASTMADLGLDPTTAFDAACACRWRELTADQPQAAFGSSRGSAR
jgi:hypothetical protein